MSADKSRFIPTLRHQIQNYESQIEVLLDNPLTVEDEWNTLTESKDRILLGILPQLLELEHAEGEEFTKQKV